MRIGVIAIDGALDSALALSVDIIAAANRIAVASGRPRPFALRTFAPRRRWIRSGAGYRIEVDATIERAGALDAVVLLGMNAPTEGELDAALARPDVAAAGRFAARRASRGALVLASCSGSFVLASTGVLDGFRATTSWWLGPAFRARFPRVELCERSTLIASAGAAAWPRRGRAARGPRIVTAGAALSHADLMLWLVRRYAGPAIADLCLRYLVIDERPSQARYAVIEHLARSSDEVARADAWARRHLGEPFTIGDLARAAGVSERTLARRFQQALGTSPLRFVQRLRAERGAHLLQTTRDRVDAIASRVGYSDPVALRRILRRELGTTPRALRGSAR